VISAAAQKSSLQCRKYEMLHATFKLSLIHFTFLHWQKNGFCNHQVVSVSMCLFWLSEPYDRLNENWYELITLYVTRITSISCGKKQQSCEVVMRTYTTDIVLSPWGRGLPEKLRSSARQGIPRILWNPKDRYRIYNSPPTIHTLSQIYPVHAPLILSF
jgi:hypothetical protein